MKKAGMLVLALVLASACDSDNDNNPAGPSTTGPIVFTAQLSAANEVPAITGTEANGRGNVTITFNVPRDAAGAITGGGNVTFAMQVTGLPAGTPINLGHIHVGAAGVNGGVQVDTGLRATAPFLLADGTGNMSISNVTITQDLATQITNNPGGYYFNLHSTQNPGGVVRGQLTRQ